jgi:hypothetical protein
MKIKNSCLPTGVVVALSLVLGSATAERASFGQGGLPIRESPYENVQILMDAPPEQLQQIMQAISVSLGVECEYCHDAADRGSDANPIKRTARDMIRMVVGASESYFEVLEAPSCWTCHRGSPTPETEPAIEIDPVRLLSGGVPFSTENRPSGEVYGNIRNYPDLLATGLRQVMEGYTRDLGVGCDYCHVEGDWADDTKLMKLLSRRMFEIQEGMESEYLGTSGAVSCWTCHRGNALPESNLPPDLLPAVL